MAVGNSRWCNGERDQLELNPILALPHGCNRMYCWKLHLASRLALVLVAQCNRPASRPHFYMA